MPEVEAGEVDASAVDRLSLMFCEAAMRRALDDREAVSKFDGVVRARQVDDFRQLDEERIRLARNEVAAAHHDGVPTGNEKGELGIIRAEIRKKRRHKQLRRLLAEAGHSVQAIKPVFMMSPISIAQFLEPGCLDFDLLVIDEASQVRPVEAFGGVMRCRQVVVVGDNRQLPPTTFFDRMGTGDADDEFDEDFDDVAAADVESILDLCQARNFPQRMLRWHYRSRHHSLIAVSNHEFYDGRLCVIPSPDREVTERGLKFHYVEDGAFDRGQSRTNPREAQVVAQAMLDHARERSHLTLGVGTFSVSQRDAILDALEGLRRRHPETEPFFSTDDAEPFFVKNLENIQGDERDVILISVGYSRDASGKMSMNFGPLNRDGGERRLNVLITRARERCEVYSSIHADAIDLNRTSSRGAAGLKTFLHFAETGLLGVNAAVDPECESDFEAQLADEVTAMGLEVHHRVGMAGFFIDLAVVDPQAPSRYMLGIECDGESYRSARWARDRDRLRQSVLESHGWTLYRMWSTDWFHSREKELQKLLAKIEECRVAERTPETIEPEPESRTALHRPRVGGSSD